MDPLLAGGALISGILISSVQKSISRKLLGQRIYEQDDETTTFASPLPRGFGFCVSRGLISSILSTLFRNVLKEPVFII